MNKYLFYIIISFFLMTGLTSAQFTSVEKAGGLARIMSMGDSPYMIDPYYMTFNPSWASVYSNFIWGDIGSDNGTATGGAGQFLGANFEVIPGLTLGLILARNDFQTSSIGVQIASINPIDPLNTIPRFEDNSGVPRLNNNIELLGSYSLMSNMNLGLGISYASSKFESTPAAGISTSNSAHQLGINAGILATFGGLGIDVGASLLTPGAKVEPSLGTTTKASQTLFGLTGRVFIPLSTNLQFVPIAAFTTESGSFDNGNVSTDLPSYNEFGVGVGLNYLIDNIFLTGGLGLQTLSFKQSSSQTSPELTIFSSTIFPIWNLGAEWKFTNWLIGRLGYTQSQGNQTTQTPATITSVDEQVRTFFGPTGFTLGLGLQFKTFQLSATVNEKVLREGLNNIGGGTPTFAYLSASMAF